MRRSEAGRTGRGEATSAPHQHGCRPGAHARLSMEPPRQRIPVPETRRLRRVSAGRTGAGAGPRRQEGQPRLLICRSGREVPGGSLCLGRGRAWLFISGPHVPPPRRAKRRACGALGAAGGTPRRGWAPGPPAPSSSLCTLRAPPCGPPAERARRRRPGPRVAPSARPGNASGRPLSAVTAAGLRTRSSLLPPPPRPAPGAGGTGRAGSGRAGGWSRRRAIPREDHDLRAALLPPDGFAFSSRFLENTFLPTGLSKARR